MPDKHLIYWDSCMFYEILGNEQSSTMKKAAVQDVLTDNKDAKNMIITSVVTHLEVLPSKLDIKGANDERGYLALFDALHFVEIELSTNIVLRAREIRDFYYVAPDDQGIGAKMMDVGDAIHLATATIHHANEFHTRDNYKKKGNLPLLDLYKVSGNPRVCGKYDLRIISPEAPQGALDV